MLKLSSNDEGYGNFIDALVAPSLIAVTQMWWKRNEQTLRTSYWSGMNGLTFIIGSLFTFGLGHIQSSALFSYQVRLSRETKTSHSLSPRLSSSSAVFLPSPTQSPFTSSCPTPRWKPSSSAIEKRSSLSKDSDQIKWVLFPGSGSGNM